MICLYCISFFEKPCLICQHRKNAHEKILKMLGFQSHPESAIGTEKRKLTFCDIWALATRKTLMRKQCLSRLNTKIQTLETIVRKVIEAACWMKKRPHRRQLRERRNNICKGEIRGRYFEAIVEKWKLTGVRWANQTLNRRSEKLWPFELLKLSEKIIMIIFHKHYLSNVFLSYSDFSNIIYSCELHLKPKFNCTYNQ